MGSSQIDALEALLSAPGGVSAPEVKTALARLASEVRDRASTSASDSYDFFSATVEAVARLKGTSFAEQRIECLYESGCFFYRSGFAPAALRTSEILVRFATRTQNDEWLIKAYSFVGVVQAEAGNVGAAIVHHSNALRLARRRCDRLEEVRILVNLGTALLYAGLYRECIKSLRFAVSLCDSADFERYVPMLWCDMAQAHLALGEHEAGLECISKCLSLSKEPSNAREVYSRSIREFTYVQLALEGGKLARAREHARNCWRYSYQGDNPRCRTNAQIAIGQCEVHGGDIEKGLATLHRALDTCGDFAIPRVDVLVALVKCYDEVGQPARALQYLDELLKFVRSKRTETLTALLKVSDGQTELSGADLRNFELREARLRAKVAQQELDAAKLETLERLAIAADLRDDLSGAHGYRVGKLSSLLAKALGHTGDFAHTMEVAGRLHDLGKIAMPDRVLLRPESLRESERLFIAQHTSIGAEMLAHGHSPEGRIAAETARHHHECWDGTGYPSKLSGKRIPIHARIVALADVFDALTHGRPYAPAWTIDQALEEIKKRRGTQFDPELTDVFLGLIDELRAKHADLDAYLAEASRNSPFLQAREKIRLMLEGAKPPENMAAAAAETVH